MKLKAIGKLCAERRRICVYGAYRNWIGDGRAMYHVEGLSIDDARQMLTIWDIDETKHDQFILEYEGFGDVSLSDQAMLEDEAIRGSIAVSYKGAIYIPFYACDTMILVQPEYIAPLKDTDVTYFFRIGEGNKIYLAAKDGMFLAALIEPIVPPDDGIIAELENVAEQLRASMGLEKTE